MLRAAEPRYTRAMAPAGAPSSSARRIAIRAALLLVPIALAAAGTPFVVRELRGGKRQAAAPRPDRPPTDEELAASAASGRRLADVARQNLEGAEYVAPETASVDAAGERTRRFEGFGLSIESEPTGARVLVGGEDLGETPLVATVRCTPGAPVQVRVERPPRRAVEKTTTCRADTLVELSVRLAR
jgi:hypothetical protein